MEGNTQPSGSNAKKRAATNDGKDSTGQKRRKPVNEGEKEVKKKKKPFICDIYRRDIVSFLSGHKIQQCRLTSRFSNASIVNFLSSLPRLKYFGVSVELANGANCKLETDGFLSSDGFGEGRKFHKIYKFRFCCREIRTAAAKELIGEKIFPGKPDDEGVAFTLHLEKEDRSGRIDVIACCVRNLLTKKTAPVLAHFLYHLKQRTYEWVGIMPGHRPSVAALPPDTEESRIEEGQYAMNPKLIQVLNLNLPGLSKKSSTKGFHLLRGEKLGRWLDWGNLSPTALALAQQLGVIYRHLGSTLWDNREEMTRVLDFVTTGRRLHKKMLVQFWDGYASSGHIDRIVRHFQRSTRGYQDAIREVQFKVLYGGSFTGWLGSYAKLERAQVVNNHDSTAIRFKFAHRHTEEFFWLVLLTSPNVEPGSQGSIQEARLAFDRATAKKMMVK